MSNRDLVRWIIDRMLAHDDSITQDLALTIERETRAEWGGQSLDWAPHGCAKYIRKTCDEDRPAGSRRPLSPAAAKAVHQAALSSKPTDVVVAEQGVSRATLYRLLKRGPG